MLGVLPNRGPVGLGLCSRSPDDRVCATSKGSGILSKRCIAPYFGR